MEDSKRIGACSLIIQKVITKRDILSLSIYAHFKCFYQLKLACKTRLFPAESKTANKSSKSLIPHLPLCFAQQILD